jgi:hypothetical protein
LPSKLWPQHGERAKERLEVKKSKKIDLVNFTGLVSTCNILASARGGHPNKFGGFCGLLAQSEQILMIWGLMCQNLHFLPHP